VGHRQRAGEQRGEFLEAALSDAFGAQHRAMPSAAVWLAVGDLSKEAAAGKMRKMLMICMKLLVQLSGDFSTSNLPPPPGHHARHADDAHEATPKSSDH